MIVCPNCKHEEYEGTLFCSQCGSRLWQDSTDESTVALVRSAPEQPIIQPTPPHTAPMAGEIYVRIQGAADRIHLTGKSEYLLGRTDPRHAIAPDIDLSRYAGQEMGVSRKHAILRRDATGVSVIDLGSANGTLVNGRMLAPDEACRLNDGDEVRLGKLVLNVFFAANS